MGRRSLRKTSSVVLALLLLLTLVLPTAAFASEEEVMIEKIHLSDEARAQMKQIITQQQFDASKGPFLHPDLANLSSDEEITVIVELTEPSVALVKGMNTVAGKSFSVANEKSATQNVLNQQQKFGQQLSKNKINAKIQLSYDYVLNGFAMKVPANQVDQLLKMDGVKGIHPETFYRAVRSSADPEAYVSPSMAVSNPWIGAPDVWALGYEGQGVKVGVIDTGIDYLHPELIDVYKGGANFVNDPVHYKTPYDPNDPYETTPEDRADGVPEYDEDGYEFWSDHGTHVAGTIAAQDINHYGIKGIAPKVDLYAYKVLGAYGSGSSTWVIGGINRAVKDGMDVINLSLGNASNDPDAIDSVVINNAVLAGTTAVVANGNSGNARATVGAPATAAFAISVGSSTVTETKYASTVTTTIGEADKTYNLNLMATRFTELPAQALTGTYDLVVIGGLGEADDYKGIDVHGKVAVIARGTIPFVDKIANAKAAGAVAAIITNNTGTTAPIGVFLSDSFAFIPTYDMSKNDGDALRNSLKTNTGTVTFTNFTSSQTTPDIVDVYSSRGPVPKTFDIKPDIVAPGTNIMSSVPAYGKVYQDADYSEAYDRFTGTSMASPHVAGVAALLKSMHPNWTPFDIKTAISNTAKQLNTATYDVFAQGPGRIQAYAAATTESLAKAVDTTTILGKSYENIKGTITFGRLKQSNSVQTVVKQIRVENLKNTPSDYTVSVQKTKSPTGQLANTTVTVDKSQFTLTDSETINVTLTVPTGTATSGEILGYINITNGTTQLSLPFAADFAAQTGITGFMSDDYHISPDGSGKKNTTLRWSYSTNMNNGHYINLYSVSDPYSGEDGDGDLGWIINSGSSQSSGAKTATFDGSYTEWTSKAKKKAPEGVYAIDLVAFARSAYYLGSLPNLIYIKNSAPAFVVDDQVRVNGSKMDFTASINDKYVDFGTQLRENLNMRYDVNDNLHASYELRDSDDQLVASNPIRLMQDGSFTISLEGLTTGENTLKLIVNDEVQNHVEAVVTILSEEPEEGAVDISAHPSATEVKTGEPFKVDVDFSHVKDLYAAQFSLTYDASLNKGSVSPSAELSSLNGGGLYFHNLQNKDLGNGRVQSDYVITVLGDIDGYTGTGSLATFNFSSDNEGDYNFDISNVRLLDSDALDMSLGTLSGASVHVTKKDEEEPEPASYTISGNIIAEAFGEDVDYSMTWYEGADTVHKVIVEALDKDYKVVALGTVKADGSYSLKVADKGKYTIRVVLPGHFGSESSVDVDGDLTVNFGPLTAGDVNGDGVIDLRDLQFVAKQFGKKAGENGIWTDANGSAANITRSGEVDMGDISWILTNYSKRK